MTQNLMSLALSADDLEAIDAALSALEARLTGLVALQPDERRGLTKMGDKSEAFCRQTVDVIGENPGVLSRNFDDEGMRRDLAMLDALRPRLIRLARLQERANDTEMALGSDLMTASLEGYAVLKVSGKSAGLDNLRQALSARFRSRRGEAAEPAAVAPM